MRLRNSVLVSALCCTQSLVQAATARVYMHDPHTQPRPEAQSRSLGPVPARLVLAQRAGVEEYHASDLSKPEVIQAINDFGRRTPLLVENEESTQDAIILVEGEDNSKAVMPMLDSLTYFELDPAPVVQATRELFVDLVRQNQPSHFTKIGDNDLMDRLRNDKISLRDEHIFHIAKSTEDFASLYKALIAQDDRRITVMVMPQEQGSVAGQEKNQWGTYAMPGAHAPLIKRERPVQEAPLSETTGFKPVQSFAAPVSAFANNTEPFRGIIQACFSSQAACESATRNCTGHGSCRKRYHDSSASQGNGVDCYSCSCSATKSTDGKKTTYWGGPACQKKDVSIEFWLIVLFSVGMIFLVGFAVGTVWDMGSQELPSVIGAGVSGPTARK